MYVIFPLDQLLNIKSADKPTKNSFCPPKPSGGPQSAKVLSSPTHPSHKVLTKQDPSTEKATKSVPTHLLTNQSVGAPSILYPVQGLQRQASLNQSPVGPSPLKKKLSTVPDLSDSSRDHSDLSKSELPRNKLISSDSFRLASPEQTSPRVRASKNKHKLQLPESDLKVDTLDLKEIKSIEFTRVVDLESKVVVTSEQLFATETSAHPISVKSDIVTFIDSEVPEVGTSKLSNNFEDSSKSKPLAPLLGRGTSFKNRRGTLVEPKNTFLATETAVNFNKINMASDVSFRELTHPALNETLKSHNSVTFKLIKTVSDFSAQVSRLHERHAEELQMLTENYRKKHSELRNEKPPCSNQLFQVWETLLQEVEVDSQVHSDIAGVFLRSVSRPLIEKTFHRKIQSRKLFMHRDSIETILGKTEEMLKKCRKEESDAYQNHCRTQNNDSLSVYFDTHNSYVQQLHATNAMLQSYNSDTLPLMLEELEEVHLDVGETITEAVLQGADILAVKSVEQNKRYETLCDTCRSIDPRGDVVAMVKYFDTPQLANKGVPHHRYIVPQPPSIIESTDDLQESTSTYPPLKNELVLDRLASVSSRCRLDSLRREQSDLEKQIISLQDGMDTLLRLQQRNIESSLYHKANELQEAISMKRFDLRVNEVHLSAVKSQKELFASREGPSTDSRERKMSNSSTGSMKSKWMKAFKSLKTPSGSGGASGAEGGRGGGVNIRENDKKYSRDRGMDAPAALFENSHILQEYTYKKITACDVCHQILRGHSRQGLKCRLCKTNVHVECQDKLPKCQPKSKLLRRQRSTSEIESKQIDAGEEETEPDINIPMLIASQPGRRMKEPPSPSTPSAAAGYFPLPPKGPSSSSATSNPGRK